MSNAPVFWRSLGALFALGISVLSARNVTAQQASGGAGRPPAGGAPSAPSRPIPTEGTSAISGTSGAAAPDYFMVAFSTDRAMWRVPSRRVRSTRPRTDGVFELRDLPPGSYYLAALTDVDADDLEDPVFLESLVSSAVTVTLGEGEQKTQNLRLGGG